MTKPEKTNHSTKIPLIFLSLVTILVISTIVVASNYFLRPQIEAELKKGPTKTFAVMGYSKRVKQQSTAELIKK